jgi:putative metalloprotease
MDMMNDDELFYVVGHEIGHVKNQDALKQIRTIYLSSGAIKAAAASNNKTGALTNTQLGDLLHSAVNAQYSQKAEYAADNYGYNLMKKYKINTNGAVTALYKIDSLVKSGGVMSSHPNSADRAKKLEELIKKEK